MKRPEIKDHYCHDTDYDPYLDHNSFIQAQEKYIDYLEGACDHEYEIISKNGSQLLLECSNCPKRIAVNNGNVP